MGLYADELRAVGEWWLPGQEGHPLPGVLTFSQVKGGELLLIGGFRSLREMFAEGNVLTDRTFTEAGDYGRICGAAQGKQYTLEGCFRTGGHRVLAGVQRGSVHEIIHVGTVFRGIEFEPEEVAEADLVDLQLLHFPYWVSRGGLNEEEYFSGQTPEGEPDHTLTHSWVPTDAADLSNGMRLTLDETMTRSGDRVTSRTWTRDFQIRLTGDRQAFDAYLGAAIAIQHLVSMAVGRAATFESVQLHHPDVYHQLPDGGRCPVPIEFYAQWLNWESRAPEELLSHQLLFTLNDLGGAEGIARWCASAARHRRPLNRVMMPRFRTGRFVDDRVFDHATALEGFDRSRHAAETTRTGFTDRILRCQALAGPVFTDLIGDRDAWAETLRGHRDDVAHHLIDEPKDTGLLHWLAESAYYLFALCMLRDMGAPDALFERIGSNSRFQDLGKRLRPLLERA